MVPEKRNGSCRTMPTKAPRLSSVTSRTSWPPTRTAPVSTSPTPVDRGLRCWFCPGAVEDPRARRSIARFHGVELRSCRETNPAGRIAEGHMIELDGRFFVGETPRTGLVDNGHRHIEHFEDAMSGGHGPLHHRVLHRKQSHRLEEPLNRQDEGHQHADGQGSRQAPRCRRSTMMKAMATPVRTSTVGVMIWASQALATWASKFSRAFSS